jgi:FdhE protein
VKPDQIKRAVAGVKAARPAYQDILAFYEKLFLAQEASKERIVPKPIDISKETLTIKRKESFPLISTKDFAVDTVAAAALLREICGLAEGANEVLAQGGRHILAGLDKGAPDASTLFAKILDEGDAYWDEAGKKADIAGSALAFLVYHAVKPFLFLCAEQAAKHLDNGAPWEKGYCPICGHGPALAVLRDEGRRFLLCSFCGYQWAARRVFCPFCENKDQKNQHYFFSEEEKEFRVHVCDACKKYIKTVDTRHLTRPFYPFLEQISTLHLDMLAREQGLDGGLPLWLQG